jgi:hypothetical protein
MLRNPVAVEKLALHEFAEIASRHEALQAISPSHLDIFYHPIFDFFQKNRLFQQPLLFSPAISKCDVSSRTTPFSFGLSAINLKSTGWQMSPEADSGRSLPNKSPLPKIPVL